MGGLDGDDLFLESALVDGLDRVLVAAQGPRVHVFPAAPGLDGGVPADGDRHVAVGRVGAVRVGGGHPVQPLFADPDPAPRGGGGRVHAACDDQLIHAGPDAGGGVLHRGQAGGAVPVHGQARDGGQARGDRGVPCYDAAAVEALAEDDV